MTNDKPQIAFLGIPAEIDYLACPIVSFAPGAMVMAVSDDLSELIGAAYQAAVEPELWPAVLEQTADLLGAQSAALHFQDQITGQGWGMVARLDPAAVPLYFGHFATRNPIRRKRNDVLKLGHDPEAWRTAVITDEHALSKPELMRSEYYCDFLRHFGIHSLLMMGLAVEETRFASINFLRPPRRPQFDCDEIAIASRLQPHLIRAFGLGVRFSALQQMGDSLMHALDGSVHAVFLVGPTGRVFHANRTGEALLARGGGLWVSSGVLRAPLAEDSRQLLQLIGEASTSGTGGGCAIARRGGRRALSVIVTPLRPERLSPFSFGPTALVCASDPDLGVMAAGAPLRALFGLTQAECRIALELLAGNEPKAIASMLSLSIHTVRVHLARIMAKTETTRQAELVRVLDRACGLWGGGAEKGA